jgi:predicted secreted protein
MGTSYTATINQLRTAHKLSAEDAASFRRVTPLELKSILVGHKPSDARSDVWYLDERSAGWTVHPRVGDEVHVYLPETPSTGFVWDPKAEETLADEFVEQGPEGTYGLPGLRHLSFKVESLGRRDLAADLRRPWQQSIEQSIRFSVDVAGRPTGDSDRGLVVEQQRLLEA